MKKRVCLLLSAIALLLSACSAAPEATGQTGQIFSGEPNYYTVHFSSLEVYREYESLLGKTDQEVVDFLSVARRNEKRYEDKYGWQKNYLIRGQKEISRIIPRVNAYTVLWLNDASAQLSYIEYREYFSGEYDLTICFGDNNFHVLVEYALGETEVQEVSQMMAQHREKGEIVRTYSIGKYTLEFLATEEKTSSENVRCWVSFGFLITENCVYTLKVVSRDSNMRFPDYWTDEHFSLTTLPEIQ